MIRLQLRIVHIGVPPSADPSFVPSSKRSEFKSGTLSKICSAFPFHRVPVCLRLIGTGYEKPNSSQHQIAPARTSRTSKERQPPLSPLSHFPGAKVSPLSGTYQSRPCRSRRKWFLNS
jgi:hypothetical protein